MGAQIRTTSGPAIERAGDLAAVADLLGAGDVLFIDEIHRLSHVVEEILYPAMEDFALDVVLGKGPGARTVRLQIEPVTVIGATTRVGSITGPAARSVRRHLSARLLHPGRARADPPPLSRDPRRPPDR